MEDTFSCIFAFTKNPPPGKMCPKRDVSGVFFATRATPEENVFCLVFRPDLFREDKILSPIRGLFNIQAIADTHTDTFFNAFKGLS